LFSATLLDVSADFIFHAIIFRNTTPTQPLQAFLKPKQIYIKVVVKMIHPQMPLEQAEVVASTARRSLEDTSGGLLSPFIQATGAQQSEAQGPRFSSDYNDGLHTAKSLLMQTASSILNIMTEAALVSTCPDGFLAVPSRIGCLLTTEAGTSLEPSEIHLKSCPALAFLSRFRLPLNQSALPTESHLRLKPPDNLVRLCKNLRMHASAADGWTAMSMKPRAAVCIFFVSDILCISICFLTFVIGLLHSSWQPFVGISLVPFFTLEFVLTFCFWRNGPMLAKTKFYSLVFFVWLCAGSPIPLLTFLGPPATLPFNSLLASTLLTGATVFASNVVNKLGRVPLDHPPAPMPNFRIVFFDATVRTLRIMDALTDMILIRLLAAKVVHHTVVLCCNWHDEGDERVLCSSTSVASPHRCQWSQLERDHLPQHTQHLATSIKQHSRPTFLAMIPLR
jgi:hypothetical protein